MAPRAGQFYQEVLGCLNPVDFHDDGQLISAIAGTSLDLETNGVQNGSQVLLNLKSGAGIALSDDAVGGITIAASGSGLTLKVNNVNNASQAILNLLNGAGITITDGGGGNVTVAQAAQPVDIGVFAPGLGSNAQILLRLPINRSLSFPAGAGSSHASASANATGDTTYTLSKNGAPFATVLFGTGTATGVWTQAGTTTFAAGDVLEIDGPATADATLADVGINLAGTR